MTFTLELDDYRQLALIRDLLHKHRADKLPKKGIIYKKYQEFVKKDRNPHTLLGQCNLILDKINAIEEEIQKALGMKEDE